MLLRKALFEYVRWGLLSTQGKCAGVPRVSHKHPFTHSFIHSRTRPCIEIKRLSGTKGECVWVKANSVRANGIYRAGWLPISTKRASEIRQHQSSQYIAGALNETPVTAPLQSGVLTPRSHSSAYMAIFSLDASPLRPKHSYKVTDYCCAGITSQRPPTTRR